MFQPFLRCLIATGILCVGTFCAAQQPIAPVRIYLQTNGTFTSAAVAPIPSDKIVTTRPMIIRARFYSKSSAASILILNLIDDVNNINLRYPVALIDKNTEGDVILYGPLLYDGRKELRVVPEILVLKADQFAKYKGLFDKYFGLAAGLVPVLSQASKFIDLGWKTAEDFYGKDKIEKFNPILVSRDTQAPLGAFPSWYVLANSDASPVVNAQLNSTGFRDPSGGKSDPQLAPGSLTGGRVVFISITPSERAITLEQISERLDGFFGSGKERLDHSKLATSNPFAGETVQANLSIRRNLETFLSMIELTRSIADNSSSTNPNFTTEGPISTLIASFKAGQMQSTGTPFSKLKPADDQQVASVFSRLFEYKNVNGTTDIEEPGLRTIIAWSNWFELRTTAPGSATQTIKFNEIKGFLNPGPTGGAYATANPNFAIKWVSDLLPTAVPDANATMDVKLDFMKRSLRELRKVKIIFNSTDSNPWLRFEQRAAASWLAGHLKDKDGNPLALPTTDFKSDSDVKNFAEKLDEFLSTAKVFEPIDLTRKEWRFRTIVDFLSERFKAELRSLAIDQQRPAKDAGIIDIYGKIIEPSTDYLAKDEKEAFGAVISEMFPKDADGKSITLAVPKSYFDNTVLTVIREGDRPRIVTAGNIAQDDAKNMIRKIAYAQSTLSSNASDLSVKLNVTKTALNLQRKNALIAVFALTRAPGMDFSIALRGVDFISRVVATNTPPAAPTNSVALTTWVNVMSPLITNGQWNENISRFVQIGPNNLDPDVLRIKEQLDNGCDRTSTATFSQCPEPSGDGATGKDLIQRLYEIICDVANNSAPKRAQAEDVLGNYIDIPAVMLDAASSKCAIYKETYGIGKLEWRKGMFRLIPPPPPPANP